MRTKTLLLTAVLAGMGASAAMAQVYSVNAVGYVNITVPANALMIVANPLHGTNNALNTILPLASDSSQDGVTIHRFDTTTQNYRDPIQWIGGFGWFSPSDANPTVNPGEGFFLQNTLATALNVTFVGEVPQGNLTNPLPGANRLALASSQVPQTAPLGDAATAASLQFPAADGDTVFVFDVPSQNYLQPFQYIQDFGWFSVNVPEPGVVGPTIPVGTGFFAQKPGAAVNWTRNFSVN